MKPPAPVTSTRSFLMFPPDIAPAYATCEKMGIQQRNML